MSSGLNLPAYKLGNQDERYHSTFKDSSEGDELGIKDKIIDFINEVNDGENSSDIQLLPIIHIKAIVNMLDPTIQADKVAVYILKQLTVTLECISVDDFIKFWETEISEFLSSNDISVKPSLALFNSEDSAKCNRDIERVFTESLDSQLFEEKSGLMGLCSSGLHHCSTNFRNSKTMSIYDLMRLSVPHFDTAVVKWECEYKQGWNEAYQLYRDEIQLRKKNVRPTDVQSINDLVDSHFSLFSVKGKFISFAQEVVKTIVDEFSLPLHLKTVKPLQSLPNINEEIYFINGIIFTLINDIHDYVNMASMCSNAYCSEVTKYTVKHAMVGHELSAASWVQKSIGAIGKGPVSNLRVPLSTVIDYAGFRFTAIAEMKISEAETLVHGLSFSENVFINSDSSIDDAIPLLASELGLTSVPRLIATRSKSNDKSDHFNANVDFLFANTLSKDTQFHSYEDRTYILNLSRLRPACLARGQTCDAHSRVLRPELFASERLRLSFVSPQIIDDDDAESIDLAHSFLNEKHKVLDTGSKNALINLINIRKEKLSSMESKQLSACLLDEAVRASCILKAVIVPETVLMLDCMIALPLDSYSITCFLHSRGVNMHLLGVMYMSARLPHVKQLLLCEIIARASKVYLRSLMQEVGQEARASVLTAEQRGRSNDKDYRDYQQEILDRTSVTVVDFFNCILGDTNTNGIGHTLWTEILPRMIFFKFNVHLADLTQSVVTHLPQLFAALQYHTNVIFVPRQDYAFGSSPTPISQTDLMDYIEGTKSTDISFFGALHKTNESLDSLLSHSMFSDALNVYRLRLSALSLSNPVQNCGSILAARNDYIYKVILCKYELEDFNGCSAACEANIDKETPMTIIGARLYTLAMCAYFRLGDITKAMSYFEVARAAYMFTLGRDHPVQALLFCALGDLYYMDKRLPQAKVMIMLAQEICIKLCGEFHIVTTGYTMKLASILTVQGLFHDALYLYLSCYQTLMGLSDNFLHDTKECLCGLSICYWRIFKFAEAERNCSLLIEVCKTAPTGIQLKELKYLLLMGNILIMANKRLEGVKYIDQAWIAVKDNIDKFASSRTVFIELASKAFKTLRSTLTMSDENKLIAFKDEFEKISATLTVNELNVQEAKDVLWQLGPSKFFENMTDLLQSYNERVLGTVKGIQSADDQAIFLSIGCQVKVFFHFVDLAGEDEAVAMSESTV